MLTAGDLDPTFGVGSKVLTDFTGPVSAVGSRVAIQNDGKIVVAGNSNSHFVLARYTVDGRLDNTFGSSGQVQTDIETSLSTLVAGVAIQADGKIIVAGTDGAGPRSLVFAVERFQSDGSLDRSFGSSGKATAGIGSVSLAFGLALQTDGKIVVVGSVNAVSTVAPGSFGVIRFNPDGSLDNSFGTGGKVLTSLGGFDYASGVAIQADGKIVVGGSAGPNGQIELALARYNANGSLDNSFGTGGVATGAAAGLYPSVALQLDGRIVLAGSLLVRFNTNGTVDGTFGMGGEVTPQFFPNGVIVQADGKIVTVGSPYVPGTTTQTFAAARYNADGSSDTTFGTGGMVTTDFGSRGAANGVALQSDGKIVAVGTGSVAATIIGFAVARYNPDGSLDAGFATGGKALTTLSGKISVPANAIAVQLDGKIVVAGGASGLVRYNADGSLDAGFGTSGRVTSAFATASGLAAQADGKIVVVGDSPAVARYNANGSLDVTFGNGGIVTTSFAGNSLAIQSDGKIVIVGKLAGSDLGDFAVARYNADGTLDTGFGSAGTVTTDFSGRDSASGVVIQGDGKIVVVGDTEHVSGIPGMQSFSADLAMARYNADGSLDATFGTAGKLVSALLSASSPVPVSLQPRIAVQADGRILVAGSSPIGPVHFEVLRFLANGNLDLSFGTNGTVTTDFGDRDQANGVVVQSDGKIIVAGTTSISDQVNVRTNVFFALARYNSDGSLDPKFGIGGKITTDFGDHADEAHAIVLEPDGKIVVAGSTASGFGVARYLPDNVGTPNQRFVEQIYWDLLRRPVDPAGLTSWSGQLDQGISRSQVATAIQASPEYHRLVVGDLYTLVLGRAVDASGLTTWVSFLNQGHTVEQLEAILLGSDEFFGSHGNQDNQLFLSALYQIVLQRSIDPTGAQGWGQVLQSGALSRQGVAASVLASLESDGLEVQSLYMQFLHRAADPGGLDTFTSALQHGVSDEQVALILMGSAEYFSRV